MTAATRRVGLRNQRGAAGLLAVLFLIVAVLVMGQALLRQSASGANDALLGHDAVAALFLAESGLERAAAELSGGVACGPLIAGSWDYAAGTVRVVDIGAGFTTDFDGSTLSTGRCRVRATGSAGLFAAQRTIEAIVITDGNLLGGANANFDLPVGTCNPPGCQPTGWSFRDRYGNPPTLANPAWDDDGGPDGSRSAHVAKPDAGNLEVTAAGQYTMTPFTVTAPTTLTLSFDYRYSCPANQNLEISVRLRSGTTEFPPRLASDNPFIVGQSTSGYASHAIDFDIPGNGPVLIDGFDFSMTARPGQPKYGWLDNLFLAGGGLGAASLVRWREIIE